MWTYGLGSAGATLCSRLPGDPFRDVLTNVPFNLFACWAVRVPLDTAPDDAYLWYNLDKFEEHFPYGYSVAADVPL